MVSLASIAASHPVTNMSPGFTDQSLSLDCFLRVLMVME
jgi:hypothetical protein